MDDVLGKIHVATIVHLIVTLVLGADLLLNGNLSSDALTYAGVVEGGNGLLSIGRGLNAGTRKP